MPYKASAYIHCTSGKAMTCLEAIGVFCGKRHAVLQFEWAEDMPNVYWCEGQPPAVYANSHKGRKGCSKSSPTKYSPDP